LNAWVHNHHPYAVPQWIEVSAENVGEKYLSWAMANSTSLPFQQRKSP
jgi:periplasmic divalent cation tolerance protein